MILLLFLILVALIGVMLGRRHVGPAATALMCGLAGLGILVALIGLVRPGPGAAESMRLEIAFERALGEVVGREIAGDVAGGGTVLLIQHVPAYLGKEVCEAQRDGLAAGLGEGGWSVDAVAVDVVDLESAAGIDLGLFSAERFSELLQDYAGAVAVVSLIGFPRGDPGEVSGGVPPLYVLTDWGAPAGAWMRSPSLKAVLTPKPGGGPPGAIDPQSPAEDLFARRYTLATR